MEALLGAATHHAPGFSGWLSYWLGLTSPDSPPYLFWSGFASCVRDIAIVGVLVYLYRQRRAEMQDWWKRPPSL